MKSATRATSKLWPRSDIDSCTKLRSLKTLREVQVRPSRQMVSARRILSRRRRLRRSRRPQRILRRRSTQLSWTRDKTESRQTGGATGFGSGCSPAPPFSPWALASQSGTCAARCPRCKSPNIPGSPTTVAGSNLAGTDGSRLYFTQNSVARQPIAQVAISGGEIVPIPTHCRFSLSRMFRRMGPLFSLPHSIAAKGAYGAFQIPAGSLRQLLTDVGVDSAAWSPDGKSVVYSTGRQRPLCHPERWNRNSKAGRCGRTCPTRSVGRRTAAGFGFSRKAGFGRFRRTDRDSTTLAARLAPLVAAMLRTLDSRRQILRFPAPEPFPWRLSTRKPVWTLDERRGLLRRDRHRARSIDFRPDPSGTRPSPAKTGRKYLPRVSSCGANWFALMLSRIGSEPWLGGISAEYVSFSPDGQFMAYVTFPGASCGGPIGTEAIRVQLTDPPLHPISSPLVSRRRSDSVLARRTRKATSFLPRAGVHRGCFSRKRRGERSTGAGPPTDARSFFLLAISGSNSFFKLRTAGSRPWQPSDHHTPRVARHLLASMVAQRPLHRRAPHWCPRQV